MKPDAQLNRSFWILAAGLFAALAAAIYFPVFLGKVPFPKDIVLQFPPWAAFAKTPGWHLGDIGDLVTSFYPYRAFAASAVKHGVLPLWNPYMSSGVPFLANAQSALFYPPNILFYVLPTAIAWGAAILLRTFLAAMFMGLFVRSIGGSKTGTVLSAILFATSGFMTGWQGQSMGDAAIWLPLICYAIHTLHTTRSYKSLVLTTFAFAMPVLAGHPETAAHLTAAGIVMALVLWARPGPEAPAFDGRFANMFALAGILALGVASIQILPILEWLGQIGRSLSVNWPTLARHNMLGLVSRDVLRSPNHTGIPIPEGAAYIGMISIVAGSLAPFHKRTRYVVFLSIVTFLALATAYSINPVSWLVAHIPVIGSLKNGRLILVASFGLSALAGLGISALEQEALWSSKQRRTAFLFFAAAFLFSFFMVYRLQRTTMFRVEFTRRPSFSRALLFVSVLPLAWRLRGGLRGAFFPVAVCSIAAFDMVTFSSGYMGFASPREVFPSAPLFDFLAQNTNHDGSRVIELWGPYPNNAPMLYGTASGDGYELSMQTARTFLKGLVEEREDTISFVPGSILALKDRRLDMLNVKYIVTLPFAPDFSQWTADARFSLVFNKDDLAVFENKSVLPRALVVPAAGIEIIAGAQDALVRLGSASFNPQESVLLHEYPSSLTRRTFESDGPHFGNVEVTQSRVNSIELRTETSEPSILVVSQIYYPGWEATVDGAAVEVFAADLGLTGAAVPAGTHRVEFTFRPLSVRIGASLTLASLLILGVLMLPGFRSGPGRRMWSERFLSGSS